MEKKKLKLFKVRATKLGFYGDSRKQPGQEFVIKEKEFSAKWMVKIKEMEIDAPNPEAKKSLDAEAVDKVASLESELEQVRAENNELQKEVESLKNSLNKAQDELAKLKSAQELDPVQVQKNALEIELLSLKKDDLIARAASLGLSKEEDLATMNKKELVSLILEAESGS